MRIHSAPMAKKMITLTPKGEVQWKGSVIVPLSLWRRYVGFGEAAERPRTQRPALNFIRSERLAPSGHRGRVRCSEWLARLLGLGERALQ